MFQKNVKILIVDDDPSIRSMLSVVLKKEGYAIEEAEGGGVAMKKLKDNRFRLVISDIKMSDINGIELLKKIKGIYPSLPVIMVTAFASTDDAVEAMKMGAEDYVIKPFNIDELKIVVQRSLRQKDMEEENIELKEKLDVDIRFDTIVGTTPRMKKIFEVIDTIAKTDSTVLITGESGTGKELIARSIHNKSYRKGGRFVSINCGALPENLLESELFGHQKGSFTDAYQEKAGLFEVADGGTLFLDEIAEMSQNMQVKLLRTLQERTIRRVGGNEEIAIDVRIIAATNRNLASCINDGTFRKDLFYRLNVISVDIPPLRERKEDIHDLMTFFLARFNQKMDKNLKGFSNKAMNLFFNYSWPGNVRELENYIERAVALEKEDTITVDTLPAELIYNFPETVAGESDWQSLLRNNDLDFMKYLDDLSKRILLTSLERNGNNLKKTADALKLNYRSLRYLIEKYNLKVRG